MPHFSYFLSLIPDLCVPPYSFDSTGGEDTGRLTVNPITETITPIGPDGKNTGVTTESSAFFLKGTTNSINIMSATLGADIGCRWDLTRVFLTQGLHAEQKAGSYSLRKDTYSTLKILF